MNNTEFAKVRESFKKADTSRKIEIYVNAQGLDLAQYRELLSYFPVGELSKLEKALG
ncbi:MAG: hypothetical protein FWC76_01325 [Defluviitaleaceae bacterium]|nr:hypothetical protein [Defluviitaleaceae bacterium]